MSDRFTGGEEPSTGRTSEPADATAGQFRVPGFLDEATVKLGHALGRGIDRTISGRHRRRLRRVGWDHALDGSGLEFARGDLAGAAGNTLEVLIDGSEALPRMARDIAEATSHVHLTGWFLSPELQLSREEEPLVVRTLLAAMAEKVDVRVLLWKGAPIPPSGRREVTCGRCSASSPGTPRSSAPSTRARARPTATTRRRS